MNHELDHAVQTNTNPKQFAKDSKTSDQHYNDKEEKRVITTTEQKTAKALDEIKTNETTRTNHQGFIYKTASPTTIKTEKQVRQEEEQRNKDKTNP